MLSVPATPWSRSTEKRMSLIADQNPGVPSVSMSCRAMVTVFHCPATSCAAGMVLSYQPLPLCNRSEMPEIDVKLAGKRSNCTPRWAERSRAMVRSQLDRSKRGSLVAPANWTGMARARPPWTLLVMVTGPPEDDGDATQAAWAAASVEYSKLSICRLPPKTRISLR